MSGEESRADRLRNRRGRARQRAERSGEDVSPEMDETDQTDASTDQTDASTDASIETVDEPDGSTSGGATSDGATSGVESDGDGGDGTLEQERERGRGGDGTDDGDAGTDSTSRTGPPNGETGTTSGGVKSERVGTYMYLPDAQKRELDRVYGTLKVAYEYEYDREFEKNRHFFPLVVKHGFETLDGADANRIASLLDDL
ncbi:hypothetical protein [Halomarina ordinaria]|uniref:DUF8160 domain-containing protein n=1 Tax=Halomarina ordinaria TaxID=3033939 RepID=A0ABD5UE32_9EURY|nr:hypothetical protein [Halomarina sp. PSRA2]